VTTNQANQSTYLGNLVRKRYIMQDCSQTETLSAPGDISNGDDDASSFPIDWMNPGTGGTPASDCGQGD
jgi:hypothetical protein